MICPRCEQGELFKAMIRKNNRIIFICNECDAIWFSFNDIGSSPWLDFGTYMEEQGLSPLWNELMDLRKI